MKNSSSKKPQPAREASSGARSIMLNVLTELAEKDKDQALKRQVNRRRKGEAA